MKKLIRAFCVVLVCALIAFMLKTFVFSFTRVSGASMGNTLRSGDIALVTEFDYNSRLPERGEIAMLEIDGRDGTYIKRVIGLPNETVKVENGKVYINGQLLNETYAEGAGIDCEKTLGADEYFVLGDDRDASYDSREEGFGAVSADSFRGRVRGIVWPFSRILFGF